MCKLKKILSSFTCFLVGLAFAGSVGYELLPSFIGNQQVEISQAEPHTVLDLCVISEERDDTSGHSDFTVSAKFHFLSGFIFLGLQKDLFYLDQQAQKMPASKNSLYITFRSFRV